MYKETNFYYDGNVLDMVEDFVYLGVLFSFNGKFQKAKKRLLGQARKAMFALVAKSRKLGLAISVQLHLFETMIVPILLYGSEVWSLEDLNILDRFQLKYCKLILNLKQTTPSCMIYGELGVMTLSLQAKNKIAMLLE